MNILGAHRGLKEKWLKKRNQEEKEFLYTHVKTLGEGWWMKIKLI